MVSMNHLCFAFIEQRKKTDSEFLFKKFKLDTKTKEKTWATYSKGN